MREYKLQFANLSTSKHLSDTTPEIAQQLRAQGRKSVDPHRYKLRVEIVEGQKRPAKDLDNYVKPIIDAVTGSGLLWRDDEQIDEMLIQRRRDGRQSESKVTMFIEKIEGQHTSVPTFFRACCAEASRGNKWNYGHPGYHLTMHLWSQQPYDLGHDEWAEELDHLIEMLDDSNGEGVWNWFNEHFPKCMELVPNRRKEQFIRGVYDAYEDGRIEN